MELFGDRRNHGNYNSFLWKYMILNLFLLTKVPELLPV